MYQNNRVFEPILRRAAPGIVVNGDGHDELDTGDHLSHGSSFRGPICESYMDPLTLTTWTSFLSTLQSAVLAFFVLPDWNAWKIHSMSELLCYNFVGVTGSGVNFSLQSWCISVRGPLYTAMFMPLGTVITTVLAAIFLREELHIGRHVPSREPPCFFWNSLTHF
nr:unnamed protein product [Digitaria exilis]